MAAQRYEFVGDNSKKFWEVDVRGKTLLVRFGRIGTNGQQTQKKFTSKTEATTDKDRLVKEKVGKGYKLRNNFIPVRYDRIFHMIRLEPKANHNEASFIAQLLSYFLGNGFTAAQVRQKLGRMRFIKDYDIVDESGAWSKIKNLLSPFDIKNAIATAKRNYFLDDLDFSKMGDILCCGLLMCYKKALINGADRFVVYDEETDNTSLAAVKGRVSHSDLDNYSDEVVAKALREDER